MAKRKIDCDLNDIIGSYMRNKKYEKSLKLFKDKGQMKNDQTKMLKRFFDYLKEKEIEKENQPDDELGFEINFGGYQPDKSARLNEQGNSEKKRSKIDGESKKKTEVPKEFLKKIQKLGMKVEDADVLYESKIDWTAVYSDNKIYCTDRGCNFYTNIDHDDLANHMTVQHNYGKYPCTNAHCSFVAYSQVSLKFKRYFGSKKIHG